MATADRSPAEAAARALFTWFPAHRVRPSEAQARAELVLEKIPLFREVPRHRLQAIARLAHRGQFRAGEVIIKMGERGSTLHVIRSGRMHVVRDGRNGAIVLASLGPGDFFGELALFDQGPRSATVIAAEDSETFSLERADILDIINRYPEMALAFLAVLCDRLRTADNLLENLGRAAMQ